MSIPVRIEVEGCSDPDHCTIPDIVRKKAEGCGHAVGLAAICLVCGKKGNVARSKEGFTIILAPLTVHDALFEGIPMLVCNVLQSFANRK